jgi:protein-tyrosine kinase
MSIVERTLGRFPGVAAVEPAEGPGAPIAVTVHPRESVNAAVADFALDMGAGAATAMVKMIAPVEDAIGAYWHGKSTPAVANQFRSLRRELLTALKAVTPPGRSPLLLVTSALPGDGKTFISMGISRSLAGTPDHRVTLIDFDAIRRTTSGLFCAEDRTGLSECLAGAAEPRQVVCATDIPCLNLIPAGNAQGDAREALMGNRVVEMLARLRGSGANHVYVLDAPPVLPVVEVASLAGSVDLVLMVARSGVTPQKAFDEALAKLGPEINLCVVLNGAARSNAGDYSDYYTYTPPVRR